MVASCVCFEKLWDRRGLLIDLEGLSCDFGTWAVMWM